MTQGERVRILRKTLGLSGEKFGSKLGVTKTAISRIENGSNHVTDQMFKSICREFQVNEIWLQTGEGSMFQEIPLKDEYMRAATELYKRNDTAAMQALISYWKLEADTQKILWDKLLEIAESYKKTNNISNIQKIPSIMSNKAKTEQLSAEEINAEVEEYRRELELEARVVEKSEVSEDIKKNA